jgi:hypothetical protein
LLADRLRQAAESGRLTMKDVAERVDAYPRA